MKKQKIADELNMMYGSILKSKLDNINDALDLDKGFDFNTVISQLTFNSGGLSAIKMIADHLEIEIDPDLIKANKRTMVF